MLFIDKKQNVNRALYKQENDYDKYQTIFVDFAY